MKIKMSESLAKLIKYLEEKYKMRIPFTISKNKKVIAIADLMKETGTVFILKDFGNGFEINAVFTIDRPENIFCLNYDGSYFAIMSNGELVLYSLHCDGSFNIVSKNKPKFIEKDSDLGHDIAISPLANIVFISAPNKINDRSTQCPGSLGAVYTFNNTAGADNFVQDQLIRPPKGQKIHNFGDRVEVISENKIKIIGYDEFDKEIIFVYKRKMFRRGFKNIFSKSWVYSGNSFISQSKPKIRIIFPTILEIAIDNQNLLTKIKNFFNF